jgi:hypothetical protein
MSFILIRNLYIYIYTTSKGLQTIMRPHSLDGGSVASHNKLGVIVDVLR